MKKWNSNGMGGNRTSGAYGLGMIGAAVFYLHDTVGFWSSVGGLLKAIVWPAFLVYHLLGL